jgi:hypothetical protein
MSILHATSFPADHEPRLDSQYEPPYNVTNIPTFPLPIKILNCYLDHIVQQPVGKNEEGATMGIATSSFIDVETMYFVYTYLQVFF